MIQRVYKPKKVKKKACAICKEPFVPKTSFIKWCCPEHGYELAKRKLENKKKEEFKEWRKHKKKEDEKLKTKSDYEKDLEREVNHIVRLIDKGYPCISSGRINYICNAGHYYSVGAHPELRFNLLNIFAQCVDDNLYRGGAPREYLEGLRKAFGEEIATEIESLKANSMGNKITIPEIKEARKISRRIVRELIKETEDLEKPFTIEERIEKRREINLKLNIYKL